MFFNLVFLQRRNRFYFSNFKTLFFKCFWRSTGWIGCSWKTCHNRRNTPPPCYCAHRRRNSEDIVLPWSLENPQHGVASKDSCTLEKNDLTGDHQKPAVCFKATGATTAVSPHSEPMKAQHSVATLHSTWLWEFQERHKLIKKRKPHNAQIFGSCVK